MNIQEEELKISKSALNLQKLQIGISIMFMLLLILGKRKDVQLEDRITALEE